MAKKPAQATIQGFVINLVKQNNTIVICQLIQKAVETFIGGESASPTNP